VDGGSGYLSQSEYATHFGVDPQGHYSISVSFPSKPNARVVVDATVSAILADVRPTQLREGTITVMRDGRVFAGDWLHGLQTRVPERSVLSAPRPNPSHGAVTLSMRLPHAGHASLSLLDVSGRIVRRIDVGELSAGENQVVWDRLDERRHQVPRGVYLCHLVVNGVHQDVQRLVVMQ
jgi:hypothetical protein